jgi:serralysin
MLPFSLYMLSPGTFDSFEGRWDTPLDDNAVSIPNLFTIEIDLFEFGDGQRYSLMDLFSPGSVESTPLPAEWSEAKDLLSRLAAGNGAVAGTGGDDSLAGTEGDDDMFGGDGADDLDPGGGDDFVRGGGGDDYVTGGGGGDNYHGGAGDDSVDYHASAAAVTVDLAAGTAAGADIGVDRLASIESVYGGAGDDSLAGDSGANSLYGDDGADLLDGRDGDDWLGGGGGADVLTGGTGADLFFFQAGGLGAGADRISDFSPGEDRIDLSWIDADVTLGGDQAFAYIGAAAFSGLAGELRYAADGAAGRLQADTDGDGVANFEILLSGTLAPLATDFV